MDSELSPSYMSVGVQYALRGDTGVINGIYWSDLQPESGDTERHLWDEALPNRRVCNPSVVPFNGFIGELEAESGYKRREDDLCEPKRSANMHKGRGVRIVNALISSCANLKPLGSLPQRRRKSERHSWYLHTCPCATDERHSTQHKQRGSSVVDGCVQYSQIRIHPGYMCLLDSAGERLHPPFRFPFVSVRTPELLVRVAGLDAGNNMHALSDRDRIHHSAVVSAYRCRQRQDSVLTDSATKASL